MPAAEHADPDRAAAAFAAFAAGSGRKRRLWAAFVLPDHADRTRAAVGLTVYAEAGWSVLRVTRHVPLIDLDPGSYLADLLRRRPPGYRSCPLPPTLDPRPVANTALWRALLATPLDRTTSVAGV